MTDRIAKLALLRELTNKIRCLPPSAICRCDLFKWATTPLPWPAAHCRCEAGLSTEVALDRFHLSRSQPKIFDIPERLGVLGATNVHHKRLVAVSNHPLQFKPLDEINL